MQPRRAHSVACWCDRGKSRQARRGRGHEVDPPTSRFPPLLTEHLLWAELEPRPYPHCCMLWGRGSSPPVAPMRTGRPRPARTPSPTVQRHHAWQSRPQSSQQHGGLADRVQTPAFWAPPALSGPQSTRLKVGDNCPHVSRLFGGWDEVEGGAGPASWPAPPPSGHPPPAPRTLLATSPKVRLVRVMPAYRRRARLSGSRVVLCIS